MTRTLTAAVTAVSVVFGGALAWTSQAQAAVIYDNLSFPTTFADSVRAVNPTNGASSDGPLADSFSTGNYSLTLTDIKVNVLRETRADGVAGAYTVVGLFSDSNTSPGTLLATLGTINDTDIARTATVVDLPQTLGTYLAPNTRYWIKLFTTTNSRLGWSAAGGDGSGSTYGTAPDQFGLGGLGEYFYAGGAIALGYGTDVFETGPAPYYPYLLRISGNIPEPATMAVLGIGMLGLGLVRRRRPSVPAAHA